MRLSVILCAHDPRPEHLHQTLAALRAQTLPLADWELLLIDNASPVALDPNLVAWHPHGRVIREQILGLARARVRGIAEARADLLVFCDDDNLLMDGYLTAAVDLFARHKNLGAAGGKSHPRYAASVPAWAVPFVDRLAVRDLGDDSRTASWVNLEPAERRYPTCAPVGAGLVLRREVGLEYMRKLGVSPLIQDRVGSELGGGGDCALVLTALQIGREVGYFPELELLHLIPAERLRLRYLARLNRDSSKSWVRLLAQFGIFPWKPISPWTIRLRQLRSFFALRAWRGPADYFLWAGACGIFAGCAQIAGMPSQGSPKSA
jgi:glycosyltransferase involved in cell wall biosynthesis